MGAYTQADLEKYDVNRAGSVEVIRQSLFDFQIYPTAGQQIFTFFANPIGAGVSSSPGAAAGTNKTNNDTNMQLSGQLPAPQSFIVESVEAYFMPGSVATANTYTPALPSVFNAANSVAVAAQLNDVYSFYNSGAFNFFIGSKSYLFESPMLRFPPHCWFSHDAAVTTTSATAGEVGALSGRASGRPYFLDPPITLRATQNFKGTIEYPGSVATPSGFNGRVGIVLDGQLFRNSQ